MLIEGKHVPLLLRVIEVGLSEQQRYVGFPVEDGYVAPMQGVVFTNFRNLPFDDGRTILPIPPVVAALRDHLLLPDSESHTLHLDEKILLRNEQTRLEINHDILQEKLLQLGVPANHMPDIQVLLERDHEAFKMRTMIPMDDREVQAIFLVTQDENRNYNIVHYEVKLLQDLDIPHVLADGIDSWMLEARMKVIQWEKENPNPLYQHLRIPDGHTDGELCVAEKVISDVFRLAESGPEGKLAAEQLQMKYWYQHQFEAVISNVDELSKKYESSLLVYVEQGDTKTIQDVVALLHIEEAHRIELGPISDLEAKMQAIDWRPEFLGDLANMGEVGEMNRNEAQWEKIYGIASELHDIAQTGPAGQEQVVQLRDKHWSDGGLSDLVSPYYVNVPAIAEKADIERIIKELAQHHIEEQTYGPSRDNMRQALAQGYYQQVPQQQIIVPSEHIEQFRVVEHYHPGHQVYEVGHALKTVLETTDYATAHKAFQEASSANLDPKTDFLLVGRFREQPWKLGLDGYPESNDGIVLSYAMVAPNEKGIPANHMTELHPIDQPITITTAAIIRLDPETNSIRFYDAHLQPLKYNTMQEKNEEYLQKQLKWVGFGDNLNEQLSTKLKEGKPEFVLTHQAKFGNDEIAAVLQFSKSDKSDLIFFNRYNVTLKPEASDDIMKQTFYIHAKADNITLKEAYNQMQGRAVYREMTPKEGEKYMAWEQLNFKETDKHGNFKSKQFNENFGYDLPATLAKFPLKELGNEDYTQRLIESLQRGNRQSVTLLESGKEQKIYVEAAPQWKSLDFYDEQGKKQNINKVLDGMKQEQPSQQQGKKEGQTQAPDDEGESSKKQGRKKGLSH